MVPKNISLESIYFNNCFHLVHFSHARQGAVPPGQGLTLQNPHQELLFPPPPPKGGEKKTQLSRIFDGPKTRKNTPGLG